MAKKPLLKDLITTLLSDYLQQQSDYLPTNLYEKVIHEVEKPLLQVTLNHTGHNLSQTSRILGISRITLRKKMALLDLNGNS